MDIDAEVPDDYCPYKVWNLTTNESVQDVLYTGVEDLFFTYFLPVIEVIGVVGNLLFIVMVLKVQNMRTITNAYLVNIAIADLFFIGYACTFYIVSYFISPVRNDMPFSSWLGCIIVWMPTYLTYFASILLITLVTVEKFYGICHPFRHRIITGKKRTVRIVIISWLLGAVLSGLVVLRYAKVQVYCVFYPDDEAYADLPKQVEICVPINDTLLVLSEAVTVIPFFLALFGNVYMYGRMIYALSHRTDRTSTNDMFQLKQKQVRNQVARILIINGIVFFCCQFPYRLLSINLFVQEARGGETGDGFLSMEQYGALAVIARGLVLVNSLANPFVYFVSSATYRQGYCEAFCCRKRRQLSDLSRSSTIRLSIRHEGTQNNVSTRF